MTATTRDRLIEAMSSSLHTRGMNATGIADVLAIAQAPKGVLYHHFPGGKSALTIAAIDASVERLGASLQRAVSKGDDVFDTLERWLTRAATMLEESSFTTGCPLATVALETTNSDAEIRSALDSGFQRLRGIIADALADSGMLPTDSERAAYAIVACYEGGLLQARVSGDIRTMLESSRFLLSALRATT